MRHATKNAVRHTTVISLLLGLAVAFATLTSVAAQPAEQAGQPAAAAPAAPPATPPTAQPVAPPSVAEGEKGSAAPAASKHWWDELAATPWDSSGTSWLPISVNKAGQGTDTMFIAVLAMSYFFFIAIALAVIVFVVKYRHRPGHKAQPSPAHSDALEITWTIIPTLICVALFVGGWRGYVALATPPRKALEVKVEAWKWAWQFTHANGVEDSNLHVPVDTPVRLVMTSRDVLHSFWVPVLRVKQDLVPRRYTYAWFHATKPGVYRLYCTEYCGTNHSQMKQTVVVHPAGGYEKYLTEKYALSQNQSPLERGKALYTSKGCIGCHTIDGNRTVGPSWKGIWGEQITLGDGSKVTVDENYIRESIVNPTAKTRPGFPPSMPVFDTLSEADIGGLIEYIKSLK